MEISNEDECQIYLWQFGKFGNFRLQRSSHTTAIVIVFVHENNHFIAIVTAGDKSRRRRLSHHRTIYTYVLCIILI